MSKTVELTMDALSPYVRKAGKESGKSWQNSRRIYDHEMLYCVSGSANVLINDTHYIMKPNTLILIKPDRTHRIWIDKGKTPDILWIHFDFTFREDVYQLEKLLTTDKKALSEKKLPWDSFIRPEVILNNGFVFPEYFTPKNYSEIEYLFTNIVKLYNEQSLTWQIDAKIMLLQIIKSIYEQELIQKGHPVMNYRAVSSKIKQYIRMNYYRKINLVQLSSFVGLSADYTSKLFKKETGLSINTFINQVRLDNAKKLLLNHELTLSNIAEMVGFSDAFYFSKVMKKHDLISPSEWRRNHQ